ncbi:hypothetical protein EJ04DRAFT_500915 [Polyplosphaeria fusca]|uniref:DUF7708 domain-containing protein n=1 Tax=Polyplosphaeria fusca TaxID=682080 RepID=A0A9P4UVQ4_9PLEO|nr:hypothetical protein EJ04DRAFT_500915 [Polyplosphaeria fusca]
MIRADEADTDPGSLVRRFTDSLDGRSALSIGTKADQAHIDAQVEAREKIRTQLMYFEIDDNCDPFEDAESIRKALELASDDFFKSMEAKQKEPKYNVFRKSRNAVKVKVEQQLRQQNPQSLEEVKDLVDGISDDWKKGHSKVYHNFTRMNQTLDAHKILLQIVPKENTYVSVVAGSLGTIVQASVYHAEIAENLSNATAHLCERVVVCSQLLSVIRDHSMQRQLGEVYKRFFTFVLKAIRWFQKSSTSRFFDSFNKAVMVEHDEAAEAINRSIDILIQKGDVAELARIEDIRRTADIIEWKVDKLNDDVVPWIADMKVDMASLVDEVRFRNRVEDPQMLLSIGNLMRRMFSENVSRIESVIGDRCNNLRSLVVGSDGLSLAQEIHTPSTDPRIMARISSWLGEANVRPSKLWIQYPFEMQEDNSARAAALGVISVAARLGAPFVSYIGKRPHPNDSRPSQTLEETGLLSLVYCLILQLLRYRPLNDTFRLDAAVMENFDEYILKWDNALELLAKLLEHTPVLRYVVLHGLNGLEGGGAGERCKRLLDVLHTRTLRQDEPFGILYTTAGPSTTLAAVTEMRERARSDFTMRLADKRGQDFNMMRM